MLGESGSVTSTVALVQQFLARVRGEVKGATPMRCAHNLLRQGEALVALLKAARHT